MFLSSSALVLRFIDSLTTEAGIREAFQSSVNSNVRRIHLVRDSCYALVELQSVADAFAVVEKVTKENKLFEIEGKAITVSYTKNNFK